MNNDVTDGAEAGWKGGDASYGEFGVAGTEALVRATKEHGHLVVTVDDAATAGCRSSWWRGLSRRIIE